MTRRRVRPDGGQALVEFALVLIALLFLIMGILDFARAWNVYQVITDAAREGARLCAVDNPIWDETAVRTRVEEAIARASLPTSAATITFTDCDAGRDDPVTVQIDYQYRLGLLGAFMAFTPGGDILTLSSELTMRAE